MKHSKFNLTCSILTFLLFFSCRTNEIEINTTEDFDAYITEEMQTQNIPALSALIFKNDDILYEHYFGKTHLQQDIDLQNHHVFLLASVSKIVTGITLLQLYEQGHFDLEDKINNHLPFPVHIPGYSTNITFKMLLTHTSGIGDGSILDDHYYYGEDSPINLNFFLENYLEPSGIYYDESENFHDFEPGTKHEYSNVGSALIALLVEEISGVGFNTYCKQNIFTPLGMTNTFWRLDEITNNTIVQPYNYANGDYEAIQHYTFTDYPNGGLRSTSLDMFKLLSTLIKERTSTNNQLLKSTTINEMITLQIPSLKDDMGLHLFLMNQEHSLWGHDGGEQGVATIIGFNPITGVGAIILTNQGDADLDAILVDAYQFGLKL